MKVGNKGEKLNAGSGETDLEECKNPSTGSLNKSTSTISVYTARDDQIYDMNSPSSLPLSPEEVKILVTDEVTDMALMYQDQMV